MAANMYKIGDYVYFEISSSSPYQVRRIEELCKTQTGSVEARVMCFYRRRDISQSLAQLADKHQYGGEEEMENSALANREDLSELQKHQTKHRELFLSRQVETLPATHIRGKCTVTLLNETESFSSYLNKEDAFFYSLVYDPQQKTLLADKGEIRVGSRYQADTPLTIISPSDDNRLSEDLETLVWNPDHDLSDKKIEGFQLIARSVGTFARSLDCSSTVRQPSLHMSAASASRDITLLHALDLLHKSGYIISDALQHLVPSSGPLLCRDELEVWSASEANLFDEALDKYGKDFIEIKNDFLPWKTLKSIIEYYYMWKTTDRYVHQKQLKTSEAENKLKQVYIPNYNKPNAAQINIKSDLVINQLCESCYTTQSSQWYAWGPSQMQCRVCSLCWIYWKKYGGLKMPTKLDACGGGLNNNEKQVPMQQGGGKQFKCTIPGCTKTEFRTKVHLLQHLSSVHGVAIRPASPSVCPVMKTRAAFCLITTQLTRISRQICKHVLNIQHAARRPFQPINIALIKQECQQRLPELMSKLRILRSKSRVPMERVSARLGIDTNMDKPLLLHHHGDKKSKAQYGVVDKAAFADVLSLPNALPANPLKNCVLTSNGKKRSFEMLNGTGENGPPTKQANFMNHVGSYHKTNINQTQPKARGSALNKLSTNGFKNSAHSHLKFRPTPAVMATLR